MRNEDVNRAILTIQHHSCSFQLLVLSASLDLWQQKFIFSYLSLYFLSPLSLMRLTLMWLRANHKSGMISPSLFYIRKGYKFTVFWNQDVFIFEGTVSIYPITHITLPLWYTSAWYCSIQSMRCW